jgi:hypothetical protein
MMRKLALWITAALLGGCAAALAVIGWYGWGVATKGQATHIDPTRSDYVDLLLTLTTVLLGAIGLAVTVGALVVGLVALKTHREIKDEAATGAKLAAAGQIEQTMANDLKPNVNARVQEVLPDALQEALMRDELAHRILTEMAQRGELDEVLERVAMRVQGAGGEAPLAEDDEFIA